MTLFLLGYMVQSIPILGSVNPDNDLIDVINGANAGFSFVNGDDEHFIQAARSLLTDKSLRRLQGNNAYKLLMETFSIELASNIILSKLN